MNLSQILRDRRLWIGMGSVIVVVLLAMQFVPLDKTNPPVTQAFVWDSPETEQIARDACYDCHSNETVWRWYGDIAPMRVLVRNDVISGREALNFSEWGTGGEEAGEIVEVISEGEMPPWSYTLMHPSARLDDSQKAQLMQSLSASPAGIQGGGEGGEGSEENEDD